MNREEEEEEEEEEERGLYDGVEFILYLRRRLKKKLRCTQH